jgi:hypothetical protein
LSLALKILRSGQQFVHLRNRKYYRKLFFNLWQLDFSERVFAKSFAFDKKSVKAAQGCKREPDVRPGHTFFHAIEQKGAELLSSAGFPGNLPGMILLEFFQRVPVRNYGPARSISLDVKIFKKALQKPVLYRIPHKWTEYSSTTVSQ